MRSLSIRPHVNEIYAVKNSSKKSLREEENSQIIVSSARFTQIWSFALYNASFQGEKNKELSAPSNQSCF